MAASISTPISDTTVRRQENQADQRVAHAPNGFGALLLAAPFAAVFSILSIIVLNISWLWVIPIYGISGAALTGLLIAYACCTRCHR